jgi:hypothetical protein
MARTLAAVLAGAALAVSAAGIPSTFPRARGGMAPRAYGAYSPFSPGSNPACASQSRLVPLQL